METSFMRAVQPYSSKPPITGTSSKRHSGKKDTISVSTTGALNPEETRERMQVFFRENAQKCNNNKNPEIKRGALNTLDNDVLTFRGPQIQSADITRQSCDNVDCTNAYHKLTSIFIKPKKAKENKQAAIAFSAAEGKQYEVANIEHKGGRVKVRLNLIG